MTQDVPTTNDDHSVFGADLPDEEFADQLRAFAADVDALEAKVVEHLANSQNPEAYLAWAKDSFPAIAPAIFNMAEKPHAKVACWLARKFWDMMPVEANGFEPVPMPLSDPETPCPFESGQTFQSCCSDFSLDLPVFSNSLWPALVESRAASEWLRLARSGALPDDARMRVAACFHASEEWKHVVDLLAPRVAARNMVPIHCLQIMELLGDSYHQLDRANKETAMLRRFAMHTDEFVRCVANRRLAMILHAEGDRERAWRHVDIAAAAAPDDPRTALQELALLTNEGRLTDAEDRAAYWSAHLLETGTDEDDPAFLLVDNFQDDGQFGRDEYFRSMLSVDWSTLLDWIDAIVGNPIQAPGWCPMEGTENDDLLRDAHVPEESPEREALELQWHSLGGGSGGDEEPLELGARVLWLLGHEEAANNLVVLADLAEYLAAHEHLLGGPNNRWHEAIVHRGAHMLESAWPDDRAGTVPWVVGDNRHALSLLGDYIDLLDEGDDEFEDMIVLYLRLNPNDNHAYRTDLVLLLLLGGRDAEALELAEQYPNDMFAETSYGKVLALYRLGREAEAVDAMNNAVDRLPLVLKYLIRNKIAPPPPDEDGMVIGGEYQAWTYRAAMRATWLAVPDMRDWLKQFIARAKAALREKARARAPQRKKGSRRRR